MFKERLDFIDLRRIDGFVWLRQLGANVDLQLSRSEVSGRDRDKESSRIAFLSETPREALEELADWARDHGTAAKAASYSDDEHYLDVPNAFIDFVIEAMSPDQADYGDEYQDR